MNSHTKNAVGTSLNGDVRSVEVLIYARQMITVC